jgi:hypothetical protein
MARLLGRLKRLAQCGQACLLPLSDCLSAVIGGELSSGLRSPCDEASEPGLSFSEIVDEGDDGRGTNGAEPTGWRRPVSRGGWKEGRLGWCEERGEVEVFIDSAGYPREGGGTAGR